MRRQHAVLWSGGFDSTALVTNILINPEKYDFDTVNDILLLCTVCHKNTGCDKLKMEKDARGEMLPIFRHWFPNITIKTAMIDVSVCGSIEPSRYMGLGQPLFWMFNIHPMLNRGDFLYLAYIQTDDAAKMISSLIRLNDCCNEFGGFFGEHKVILRTPMLTFSKEEILMILHNFDNHLPLLCSTCESPIDDKSCGSCIPCNHLKETLFSMLLSTKPSEQTVAKDILRAKYGIEFTDLQLATLKEVAESFTNNKYKEVSGESTNQEKDKETTEPVSLS